MNFRLAAPDQSLNAPIGVDNEAEWQDRLVVALKLPRFPWSV